MYTHSEESDLNSLSIVPLTGQVQQHFLPCHLW